MSVLERTTTFFLDLVENEPFAKVLIDKIEKVFVRTWELHLDAVGKFVDVVETTQDYGHQRGHSSHPR